MAETAASRQLARSRVKFVVGGGALVGVVTLVTEASWAGVDVTRGV
jgi:hypothetical protein